MLLKNLIEELQWYQDYFNSSDAKVYFGDPNLIKVFMWVGNKGATSEIEVFSLDDGTPCLGLKNHEDNRRSN